MRRIVIAVLSVLIAVSLVGGGVVIFRFLCAGPSLRVTGDSQKKDVFVTFLGEYCDSLSTVTVSDSRTNAVVWDVEINKGVAFCNFSFSVGNNVAFPEGVSRVIFPANQKEFTLAPHTKYKVRVRRAGSMSFCTGSETFEF